MNKNFKLFLLTSFLLLINTTVFAETITFSANSMSGSAATSSSQTILRGNATVITETMEIHAQEIILSGDNYTNIKASGNITGKNKETGMTFSCQYMTYNRNTNIATLQDSVIFIDTENQIEAKAQHIEYNQNNEIAIMQIDVELSKEDKKCTAAYAVYKKDSQLLELSGNACVTMTQDIVRSQNITFNLQTNEINFDGHVKGTITTSGE